jgi:ACS family sodium-dependent inorganic phosphate cotransporter
MATATNSSISHNLCSSSTRKSSSFSSCHSLAPPHLSFVSLRKTKLGFETKISNKKLEWKRGRTKKQWSVRCTAEGIDGGMFVGGRGREDGIVVSIPERYKVVLLLACVMCLCNADRVVMSVAIVPLAAKHGWSSSFLGIVQVLYIIIMILINTFDHECSKLKYITLTL